MLVKTSRLAFINKNEFMSDRKKILESLEDDFQLLAEILIDNCLKRRIKMIPYFGIRTPYKQAELWRQSRSTAEINRKIRFLESKDAKYLAHCIDSVGPQYGGTVTNAIPGLSWHQWGLALDCFWELRGKAEWSISAHDASGLNGYLVYASEAKKLGLTAGGYWQSLKDWPHVQAKKQSNPLRAYSYAEISEIMEKRFG